MRLARIGCCNKRLAGVLQLRECTQIERSEDHVHRIVVVDVLNRVLVLADSFGIGDFADRTNRIAAVAAIAVRIVAMQANQFAVEHEIEHVAQKLHERRN